MAGSLARGLPWIYSVGLHAALLVMLTVSFAFNRPPAAPPAGVAVEAAVVDEARIQEEIDRLAALERSKAQEQQRQVQQAQAARKAREIEEARLKALEQRRELAEREAQRREDQERQQREQEARAAEQERLAALEKQRQEEEARQAALAKERAEAEARKKRDAEARKQRELEGQLKDALAAEDSRRQAEKAGLLDQYRTLIAQKIERNWARPANAQPGLACDVNVTQIPGGEVVAVRVGRCNVEPAVLRSIEAAVYKASPLPPPPDPSLFERELLIKFEPE